MGYRLLATAAFEGDLDAAVTYYLEQAGPKSAARFLDKYDTFCELAATLPRHGSLIGDSGLRWRQLDVFIVVYSIDDEEGLASLLRLYYLSSDWRARTLS